MKTKGIVCTLLGLIAIATPARAGDIHPGLQSAMDAAEPDDIISALVYMKDQVDLDFLTQRLSAERASRQKQHEQVVTALQQKAKATRDKGLFRQLTQLKIDGGIKRMESFWIVNTFVVDATKSKLTELAKHPEVGTIYLNYKIQSSKPVPADTKADKKTSQPRGSRSPEPGLVAIHAPDVWDLGYTGEGILVASLDTGVDGSHPALQSRWRGLDSRYVDHPEWAFFDPQTGWTTPQDSNEHGTHTMGTICGGTPGDQIGVAPGAEWIHAAVIDRGPVWTTIEDAILAFQWIIDPDGNPATVWDVPQVCSNSWGIIQTHGTPPYSEPCDDGFWAYIDACEAVGCVILFAAGNAGSSPNTVSRPADRATDEYRTCSVAAVDGHRPEFPAAYFSSRGPTYCTPDGEEAIKPDIAAPGLSVRSSRPGGSYFVMSGTSMAAPHIAGVVALMLQACPTLTPDEVKQIIYDTALDLGPTGKDNTFGYGMINAYEAVLQAEALCHASPPRAYDASYEIIVDTQRDITLAAVDHDQAPGGPLTYIIQSLPGQGLIDAGNDHTILETELPYTLVNNGNVVRYAPTGEHYGTEEFQFTADDGGVAPDGGESDAATVFILTDRGIPVITTESLPNGCLNAPYGPVQLDIVGGQPEVTFSIKTDVYEETSLQGNLFAEVGTGMSWQLDESNWPYSLPFVFPYFNDLYDTVYVHTNGFIDFAQTMGSDSSNSTTELLANPRIAPLWDDWKTDCGGADDIYIDESVPGEVTFRWKAKQWPCAAAGDFSCTLTATGGIFFHYGATNTSITPTIGISAGDSERYVICTYDGAASLTNADSLQIMQAVSLPDGMSLTGEGILTGTPTTFGLYEPYLQVIDSFDRVHVKQLELLIEEDCGFVTGDLNCDGSVDMLDIAPFVLALTQPDAYLAQHPSCDAHLADCNEDEIVNGLDIDSFLTILVGER